MTVSEKGQATPERDRQRTVTVKSVDNSMIPHITNHVNGKEEEDMEISRDGV